MTSCLLVEEKLEYSSISAEDTISFGRILGGLLISGDVVGVTGALGSGKTWFAKGIAEGVGVDPREVVTSPSFSLVNEYEAEPPFYHMDLYRLHGAEEITAAGLEEYLGCDGITLVEWSDRCLELLPGWTLSADFTITGEN
ncbi:MAG: tRNA (adenosine(37)-N6)-threonylcarbamoyltransferase complex ATPase subunit type 1 TsaE, partial [Desulfobacteraceae bacterium]